MPLFFEKAALPYLKWVVVSVEVVAPAAIAWGLLGYMAVRVVADKLLLRTSGDKVRVRA